MIDLAPELLEKIQKDFLKQYNSDGTIKKVLGLVKDNKTTYADANEYSIRVGEMLSNSYKKYLTDDTLPESRFWYNMATTIMQPTLENNYDLIVDVCESAQQTVNTASKVSLGYVQPALNQNKIDGFINKLSNTEVFSDVQWLIGEPVVNFSQAVVDDSIKANASFHAKSGLTPKIVRKLDSAETRTITRGKSKIRYKVPCKWCEALAGTWNYLDMPDFIANNIFRRHENCRCTVEYVSDGKRQNVWTKKYIEEQEEEKQERIRWQQEQTTKIATRKEAYDVLRKDIGFDLVEDNISKINDELLITNTRQLKKLEDRFGIIHQSSGSIGANNDTKSTIAYVSSRLMNPLQQNLSLCPNYYKNSFDWFVQTTLEDIKQGHSMPCLMDKDTLSIYTVTHEYGHMIQNKLIYDYRVAKGWTESAKLQFVDFTKRTSKAQFKYYHDTHKTVLDQCFNEIIEIAKRNNPAFNLSYNISTYGKSNKAEFFAEVFANSQLGAPNELGKAMIEWLEEKGF